MSRTTTPTVLRRVGIPERLTRWLRAARKLAARSRPMRPPCCADCRCRSRARTATGVVLPSQLVELAAARERQPLAHPRPYSSVGLDASLQRNALRARHAERLQRPLDVQTERIAVIVGGPPVRRVQVTSESAKPPAAQPQRTLSSSGSAASAPTGWKTGVPSGSRYGGGTALCSRESSAEQGSSSRTSPPTLAE
jgi:hypothetical protein